MGSIKNIGSTSEWQSTLSGNTVVVADFYADWCGPCKMMAPHFDRLSNTYSKPKHMAFVKVDTDSQTEVAGSESISAMPTFKIYHGGKCIETIRGANPGALADAVSKAAKLAGAGAPANVFKTPGRKLGGESGLSGGSGTLGGGARSGVMSWDLNNFINSLVVFFGLYFTSLFSFDAYKAAEGSRFNVHQTRSQARVSGFGSGGQSNAGRPTQPARPAFKTLSDLGSEE